MSTPTASPVVSSTVGLKNMVLAPLTEDTETTLTYGTLQLVAGAIEASITPENADPDILFADDQEFDVLYPDPELSFKTKMADIPLTIQEQIFGNKIEKSNGKYRFVWLFKVRAKPVTESYQTKEGGTVTRQTGEVEWTAIKRTHDGQYQAVADEGENGFTAELGATFLQSVYTPVFTVTP